MEEVWLGKLNVEAGGARRAWLTIHHGASQEYHGLEYWGRMLKRGT